MCLWWQFEFVCQKHSLPFVCLPVAVIVKLIVGRESDEASPSSRQREEDLSGCVFPHLIEEERKSWRWRTNTGKLFAVTGIKQARIRYLCVIELLPLWCDKVEDAVGGSREGHSSDQQDHQHHVGKCGCEINHLTREEAGWGKMSKRVKDKDWHKMW